MSVRGVYTVIDEGVVSIAIQAPPAEIAADMEKINETGEIILAGLPGDNAAVFLMVLPENVFPSFHECLEAGIMIAESAGLEPAHAEHLSLLLGVVAHDPKNRSLTYRLEHGSQIAAAAAVIISQKLDATLPDESSEAIRENIVGLVMDQLQAASETEQLQQVG